MKITLRFFASVREALGTSQEVLLLEHPLATAGHLRQLLIARGAPWSEALAEGRPLRMACDQLMCHAATPLPDTCEVAFFPPVTGG